MANIVVLLLGAAGVVAVPIMAPLQKFGRPPVASPTAVERRFDGHGNEIKLSPAAPHQFETRRRLAERMEFEAALNPVVNAVAWDGVEGYTTYQLSLDLTTRSDAHNIYSIHGTPNSPLTLPPAFQVPIPFGSVYGGVDPRFIDLNPVSAFDSWLTIGITTGASTASDKLGMVNLDLQSWSETQGVVCDNGAMFYLDPADGPTLEDRDGDEPIGPRDDRGEIVVAQLTVPNEGSYTVTMNAQGRTKGWEHMDSGAEDTNWSEEGITFTFGDAVQSGTHTEPPPPPPSTAVQYETAAVVAVVETISSDGIAGHSTFRLALRLQGDALNIYSIYGQEDHPMILPPAWQNDQRQFGADIGGVSPALYTSDSPGAAAGEFDSWLTVGLTEGSGPELSNIGIPWPSWTETTELEVTDGSVFWMDPSEGPSRDDRDGTRGPVSSGGDIVVAQLTVPNDRMFTAIINAQGHRMDSDHTIWNEVDIEFTFGQMTAAVGPCTIQASAAATSSGSDAPQCNAAGGFLAMQCMMKDHCFCVDEDGHPLPRDRVTTHATGGAHFTEAACMAARDISPPLPSPPETCQSITCDEGMECVYLFDTPRCSPSPRGRICDGRCQNGGVCTGTGDMARCDCPTNFRGVYCTERMGGDDTSLPLVPTQDAIGSTSCLHTPFTTYQPCRNGGICTDTQEDIANSNAGESHCDCNSNWSGAFCEVWGTSPGVKATQDTLQGQSLSDHSKRGSRHHRFLVMMFCLVAGFAAVGVVAYTQRSGGDGGRTKSVHGSIYENSMYGGMASSVSDAAPASNAARTALQPTSMIDKAKELASKAGAKGVTRGAARAGERSIYDVGTSDGL